MAYAGTQGTINNLANRLAIDSATAISGTGSGTVAGAGTTTRRKDF
jgi:hypothetical protein